MERGGGARGVPRPRPGPERTEPVDRLLAAIPGCLIQTSTNECDAYPDHNLASNAFAAHDGSVLDDHERRLSERLGDEIAKADMATDVAARDRFIAFIGRLTAHLLPPLAAETKAEPPATAFKITG